MIVIGPDCTGRQPGVGVVFTGSEAGGGVVGTGDGPTVVSGSVQAVRLRTHATRRQTRMGGTVPRTHA